MNRRFPLWAVLVLMCSNFAFGAPVRVSFLDTDESREETLKIFIEAGCDSENVDAIRKAIIHYYQTPLALDTTSFPPAKNGFHEFAAIAGFVSALGTNQLFYLDHPFELNCFDTALLLAESEMSLTADMQVRNGPYLAIQVTTNFNEWLVPVASLDDVYALSYPAWYGIFMAKKFGMEFSEKHKTLSAALYQYQTLPLGTAADTIAAETREALRHHWNRCGIQFPSHVSLVMLHRTSTNYHLAVTDHMGVLLKRNDGYLYLEKTGGRGPFLRIDIQNPTDVATYFSTGTWPDYPFNYMSVNDDLFLDVPLNPRTTSPVPTAAPSNSSTAARARQAIWDRYNHLTVEQLNERGYAPSTELNLIPDVRMEDIRADFTQGTGNELEGKFRAAHSSSALAANTFGPWRKNPQPLHLLGRTGFTVLQFEKQCPTGLGGFPPNLDLLVESPDCVIGVESKFLEFLTPKQPKFTDSYTRENLPQMEECWAELIDELKSGPKQYLDAAQLVRHYLGLRNQPEYEGKKIILLYLFWEPENWAEFPEYRQHRKELVAFQEKVSASDIPFVWFTYPQLWRRWDKRALYPDHLRHIQKRYLLTI